MMRSSNSSRWSRKLLTSLTHNYLLLLQLLRIVLTVDLEFKSTLTRTICQCLHTTMIKVTTTVKHDLADACILGPLGNGFADNSGLFPLRLSVQVCQPGWHLWSMPQPSVWPATSSITCA